MEVESELDLRGFAFSVGLTEFFGALAVILVVIWTSHYRGGFSWTSDLNTQFNWHPLLMSIGMVFIYGNTIMIYRIFRNKKKTCLKWTHAVMHIITMILIVIGLQAVFDTHNLKKPNPIPNLYSLHSWIGLTVVTIFFAQWLAGFVLFLYPGVKNHIRAAIMPSHRFTGTGIFILSVATALLGLTEKALFSLDNYSALPSEALMINSIGFFFMIYACLVVYIVTVPRFRRIPRPEDKVLLTDAAE